MKKIISYIFFNICIGLTANAQQDDTIKQNEYKQSYDEDIKLRLGYSNSFNSFRIISPENNLDFVLSPNQRLRTTLTVMYKFIDFDIGYTPSFIRANKDDDIKGKTKFVNFGTRLYLGKWMQTFQYSMTRGFYVDKADLGIAENVLFPDFTVSRIGGSTSYIFNPDFSFRAIISQSEWQKKSAGTFVPTATYRYTQITNNDPATDHTFEIAIGPGYYYNWIIAKRLLVSGGVYAGLGYNYTKTVYSDGTPDGSVDGLLVQAQLRITLGYNSENFYGGLTSSAESFGYDSDSRVQVQDMQQFFEIYIGYRFTAPKKIRDLMYKAEQLLK